MIQLLYIILRSKGTQPHLMQGLVLRHSPDGVGQVGENIELAFPNDFRTDIICLWYT